MKKIGLSYDELTAKLKQHGWWFNQADYSWRPKLGVPLSEPAVSCEALRDVCEVYPSLTTHALNILLAGHGFDIEFKKDGHSVIITLQPTISIATVSK